MSVPTSNLTPSATARLEHIPPAPGQSQGWLARILRDRIVQIGIAAWIVFAVSIPFLARGTLPFDQPDLAGLSYSVRVWSEVLGPVYALILICLIFALTHSRAIDIGSRIPDRIAARRETIAMLVYGATILIAGQFVGRSLGVHGLGLHLSGSMFGLSGQVTPREVYSWSIYNFVFYALIPYAVFRWLGYSNHQLCLRSSDLLNDTLVCLRALHWARRRPSWESHLAAHRASVCLGGHDCICGIAFRHRAADHDLSHFDSDSALQEADWLYGSYSGSGRLYLCRAASLGILDSL